MVPRWIGFAVGLALLAWTWLSVVGTLVVPRAIGSPMSKFVDRSVDLLFRGLTVRVRSYDRRDATLAWQAPVALLVRLALWMSLFLLGYSLVLLPYVGGPIRHAFSEAGSSMFTLGYSPPAGASSTLVDYFAAYTGLIVVALQIGYLPTLYAAFNRRETEVTLLMARAGLPAWGPELLARTRFGIDETDTTPAIADLFVTWERWSAEVAESHTTYLTLVRLRSPRSQSHWLISLLAIMDAAAMHLSLSPTREPRLSARLCIRMGFVAMQRIGAAMGISVEEDPDPDGPISISYEQFAEAVQMLLDLGYPTQAAIDEAWPNFRGWRVNYERVALALAYAVDAPPAMWSGPRRWPSTPIAPQRPANRRSKDATPRAYP
jgi:hypothetical protein